METLGWFARQEDETSWSLYFQAPGVILKIEDMWWRSEAAALEYAREHIVGVGMWPTNKEPNQ